MLATYFFFFPQYLEFLLRLLYIGSNPAGPFLLYWWNVQIISYYQVTQMKIIVTYLANVTAIYILFQRVTYFFWLLGLNSQYLFKAEGDKKVIQQLVSTYNQGILRAIC